MTDTIFDEYVAWLEASGEKNNPNPFDQLKKFYARVSLRKPVNLRKVAMVRG